MTALQMNKQNKKIKLLFWMFFFVNKVKLNVY